MAVIDTGVQRDHPDLGDRLVNGFDFVGDDPIEEGDEDNDPTDGNGHGTHVTGIVAANRDNDEGITGVAPGARVLPLRVLDDDGSGYADDTIKAIDYAIDKHVHVINLSLGDFLPLQSTLFDDPDYKAVLERAVGAGHRGGHRRGQQQPSQVREPERRRASSASAPWTTRGIRSAFSSFGSNVDLMAPGGSGLGGSAEDVLSTYTGSGYESISGHLAGGAARGRRRGAARLARADGPGGRGPDRRDRRRRGARARRACTARASWTQRPRSRAWAPPPRTPATRTRFAAASPRSGEVSRRAVRRRGFRVTCAAVQARHVRASWSGAAAARSRAGAVDVPADDRHRCVTAALNRRGRSALKNMGERLRVRAGGHPSG